MQKYVAVLAFTLSTATPAFGAAVTTDQSATTPSAARATQTPRATTPPPAQAASPGEPARETFAQGTFVPIASQTAAPSQSAPGAYVPVAPQAPPTAMAPVAPTSGPRPPSLPSGAMAVNIRLDLVLTDNFGGTPTKKTVSMVIMNRQSGMIRTQNHVGGFQVRLDVDAAIEQHATGGTGAAPIGGGPLTLRLTLQYTPAPTDAASSKGMDNRGGNVPAGLNESLAVILQDGKPLLISQSADPTSDRRVTVEVTATVLK